MRNYIGVQFEFSKAMYDRNLQDELAKESTENINQAKRLSQEVLWVVT